MTKEKYPKIINCKECGNYTFDVICKSENEYHIACSKCNVMLGRFKQGEIDIKDKRVCPVCERKGYVEGNKCHYCGHKLSLQVNKE